MFLDEYRNTKQIAYKNGFLRNAYNRQSAAKGIKRDFGIREAKIRGTLIISGEETPEDNALLTRCVVVRVSDKQREINHFNWFMSNKGKFSYFTLELLRRRKESLSKFIETLNLAKEYFTGKGADDRTAINYATIIAGYSIVFDEDINFARWLSGEATRVQVEYQSEQAVEVFLEDLGVLKTKKMIDENYWELSHNLIYLYFYGIYHTWASEYRKVKGIEPFKASAIRDYLKEEPGFVAHNETHRVNGQLKKCMVFDFEKAPEAIKALVTDFERIKN
jgi:hypothetical protein